MATTQTTVTATTEVQTTLFPVFCALIDESETPSHELWRGWCDLIPTGFAPMDPCILTALPMGAHLRWYRLAETEWPVSS